MSSVPESWLERGHMEIHNPRGSPDSAFGVRVQVQGVKGHPYVVLNNGGQESHRDVSVITHQSENDLAGLRASSPRGCVDKRPPNSPGYFGATTPYEFWEPVRTDASPKLHYQRHPELLRPYDPENNNLNLLVSLQTASAGRQSQFRSGGLPEMPPAVTKAAIARIPLPAEGRESDVNMAQNRAPALDGELPTRYQNPLQPQTISSVGKLIDQFDSIQRSGRRAPRSRIDVEDRRRSRSVDVNRTSVSTSPSSNSTSYLKTNTGGTQSEASAPGTQRSRLLNGKLTLASQREENKATPKLTYPREQPSMHLASPHTAKAPHRVEETATSRPTASHTVECDEREAQVTPDLLKGQQELSVDSNEDTAKQILFFYLKDGTTDNDTIVLKKVKQMFDTMNTLKLRTAEELNEDEKDYTAEPRCLQGKQAGLEEEVSKLKKHLEVEIKNEKTLAKACEKARTQKKTLQDELVLSRAELSKLRDRLTEMEEELQSTKQELVRLKTERDRSKTEMKDLQQQLSEMHDELDQAKSIEVVNTEKEVLLNEMSKLRAHFEEVLHVQEEQEEVLHQRERELNALKGALKEELATHDKLVSSLKEEFEQEVQTLQRAVEQAKEVNAQLGQNKVQAEEERRSTKVEVRELSQERDRLKEQVLELENKVDQLNHTIQESQATEKLLEHRLHQLEREKQQVEESLINVRKKEDDMCHSNKSLLVSLEDVQGKLTKLNHEHREVKDKLKEERRQTEELWKTKRDLEEEKRHQDKMVEQLQRKMNNIMEECETATDTLQNQVDEARERSERELYELRRQLQDKGVELEKSQHTVKHLQAELLPLEEDLRRCRREQQEAQLRGKQLEQRVGELEDRNTATVGDRERQVKLMEGRIIQLEEDLREERSSADRLMERVDKTKEQMDQMRNELLQERSVKQDLECDKISLERQNKDLKSRVSHLEGSQRNNQDSLVSKLNSHIQELEDRLQGEERENNNLQQANRKLERKVKEMKMQVDEDKTTLQSHTDQLLQRIKTAKRQMDEAEEEIERLEHAKKKLQRELDEQVEGNEQIQDQLNALRNEMRYMKKSKPLLKIVEDDDADGSD